MTAHEQQYGGRYWEIARKLRQHIDNVQPPDSLILVITALTVGVGTGYGAVVFIWLLHQIGNGRTWLQRQIGSVVGLMLGLGLAGLVVGYVVDRWAREAKGHGVPEVMEAIALKNGRIRARVAALKIVASALTIGSGGSAGREGPIVQVGSALGSTIGQILHFSAERIQTLVACGAAAGIAATFNAPIAGALFALEIILGKFTVRYFGAVVISSVAAAVVGRAYLGDRPAFLVPAYPYQAGELPIYVLLGILAAVVAVTFVRLLYRIEAIFDHWTLHPAFKAAIGMLLTGAVSLPLAEDGSAVLGPGLEFIGEAIAEGFSLPLALLASLLVLKLLATSFTLGSGNSGGVFAPGLFMGAMLGGMVGSVAHTLWPELAPYPGAYAIVGMAAVFSGAARAPITAVLIVFEMSNDYKLILPLMLSTVLATLLAEIMFTESIYTLKLKLKGITLSRGRDLDLMQNIQVKEAMTRNPYVVQANTPLDELSDMFLQTHSHSFPIVDENASLAGMVSLRDFERALEMNVPMDTPVIDIATTGNLLVAYEDEPLSAAIQRLGVRGVNKMPVVVPDDSMRVVGVIRRRDIVKAYNVALARKAKSQFDSDKAQLRLVDNTAFLEVEIPEFSPIVGQTLAMISPKLPHDCVVVSVRRHGAVIIPHGDTVLQAGDTVNFFLRRSDEGKLRHCLFGDMRRWDVVDKS